MPKTFVAQNIVAINGLAFQTKDDIVVGLIASCDVNYGELGLTQEIDLWSKLTKTQRNQAQSIYNAVKNKLEDILIK